eukprot:15335193-Ditylum_brightwellii.AAC.1
MPGYIRAALHKYQHPTPLQPEHSPYKYDKLLYSKKLQYAPEFDDSPSLSRTEKTRLQGILGTLLFYAQAVYQTMLMAINAIASQQANPSVNTAREMVYLLNYCAMHPESTIRYTASNMVLHIHSNALFLTVPGAKSGAGNHFCLSTVSEDHNNPPSGLIPINGPIHTICKVLWTVIASATEADIGGLFVNTRKREEMCLVLMGMGHPHPPPQS